MSGTAISAAVPASSSMMRDGGAADLDAAVLNYHIKIVKPQFNFHSEEANVSP